MRLSQAPKRLVAACLPYCLVGVCALLCCGGASALADELTAPPKRPVERSGLGPESESAARTFAAEHHPELAALLEQLEKTAPAEYAAAVKDLDAARRHIETLRKRLPIDYELGLKDWKLMSRIRLRLAQMAPADDPARDEQLRALVKERVELRQRALRAEREFVMRRCDKITAELIEHERDPVAVVARELDTLQKSLRNAPLRPAAAKQ
jgi:hypothetical protein